MFITKIIVVIMHTFLNLNMRGEIINFYIFLGLLQHLKIKLLRLIDILPFLISPIHENGDNFI